MKDATLACWMIGPGAAGAVGRAVVLSEVGLATDVVVVALSSGAGVCEIRHPKTAAPASAPHTATPVANTLIRE